MNTMQFVSDTDNPADAPYKAGGQFIERTIHAKGGKYTIRYYGASSINDFAPHVLQSIRRNIGEGIWDGFFGRKSTGRSFRWAVVGAPAAIADQIHYERFDPEYHAMMCAMVDELLATIAAAEGNN